MLRFLNLMPFCIVMYRIQVGLATTINRPKKYNITIFPKSLLVKKNYDKTRFYDFFNDWVQISLRFLVFIIFFYSTSIIFCHYFDARTFFKIHQRSNV